MKAIAIASAIGSRASAQKKLTAMPATNSERTAWMRSVARSGIAGRLAK